MAKTPRPDSTDGAAPIAPAGGSPGARQGRGRRPAPDRRAGAPELATGTEEALAGRQTSPARIAANRANAAKSRQTVGRPPAALPGAVLAELGTVPADPAQVPGWLLRASAALWLCEASGQISGEYASRLRNGLAAIARFAPAAPAAGRPPAAGGGDEPDEWDDEEPHAGGPHREKGGLRSADQAVAVG